MEGSVNERPGLPEDLSTWERPGFRLFTSKEAEFLLWACLAIALLADALGVWK